MIRQAYEVQATLAEFIEAGYTTRQLHSSPGAVPPAAFEEVSFRTAEFDSDAGLVTGGHSSPLDILLAR